MLGHILDSSAYACCFDVRSVELYIACGGVSRLKERGPAPPGAPPRLKAADPHRLQIF